MVARRKWPVARAPWLLLMITLSLSTTTLGVRAQQQSMAVPQAQGLLNDAEDLVRRGRTDAARELWNQVLTQFGKTPQAATALLRLAQTETDLLRAVQLVERLQQEHPGSPEIEPALALEGDIYHLLGDYDNAAQVYSHYLWAYPQGPAAPLARERLINSLIVIGQPASALQTWDQAAAVDPAFRTEIEPLMLRADALIALGSYQDALDVLRDVIARFPNREGIARAHLAAGLCLESLGRYDEASQIYESLVRLRPQSVEAPLASQRLTAIRQFQIALRAFAES
jgi:tetratricopeptide (TPR) repeat protein